MGAPRHGLGEVSREFISGLTHLQNLPEEIFFVRG